MFERLYSFMDHALVWSLSIGLAVVLVLAASKNEWYALGGVGGLILMYFAGHRNGENMVIGAFSDAVTDHPENY